MNSVQFIFGNYVVWLFCIYACRGFTRFLRSFYLLYLWKTVEISTSPSKTWEASHVLDHGVGALHVSACDVGGPPCLRPRRGRTLTSWIKTCEVSAYYSEACDAFHVLGESVVDCHVSIEKESAFYNPIKRT